ncbi:MAG: hypothetical protein HYY85_11455 [Deltaproteobacteria bacterium]|nr:hypothetical protein [Deltaproteobacteria bacterium]
MRRFRNRAGWMRSLGLAAVPVMIAVSFLGLLIGITGLCIGADNMGRPDPAPPDSAAPLCFFFCGAITATAVLFLPIGTIPEGLSERGDFLPIASPRFIFHPPTALAT